MHWTVKTYSELSVDELYAILQLRSEVFVVEQNCVYQDIDNLDKQATHLMAFKEDKLIGYARLFAPNIVFKTAVIGRVIVQDEYRKTGFGKELMQKAIGEIERLFNQNQITISAQVYLLKFYTNLGFVIQGENYLEDNIPHVKMKLLK